MALDSRIPIEIAKERGNQHWKARLTNWGNKGTGADAESLAYNIPIPIVGAQISSESVVGEAIIRFNPPTRVVAVAQFRLRENELYIRRGQPYFWRTPAAIQIVPTPQTQWGDEYRPTGDPAGTANFGGLLAANVFPLPELDVILFLDHRPAIVEEPAQPYHLEAIAVPAIADANEHILRFTAILHRNRVRVAVGNHSDTDPVQMRFTGIQGYQVTGVDHLREFNLFSAPIVVHPNTRESISVKHPEAMWLGVYGQKQFHTAFATVLVDVYAD